MILNINYQQPLVTGLSGVNLCCEMWIWGLAFWITLCYVTFHWFWEKITQTARDLVRWSSHTTGDIKTFQNYSWLVYACKVFYNSMLSKTNTSGLTATLGWAFFWWKCLTCSYKQDVGFEPWQLQAPCIFIKHAFLFACKSNHFTMG